jgi:DNA-binding FrmR family transcriptional regulator
MMEKKKSNHPDHARTLHRISRIEGQLAGVRKMIEGRRYCPEILIQTRAIKAAIDALEAAILEKHLHCCVRTAFRSDDEREVKTKVRELTELFRRGA